MFAHTTFKILPPERVENGLLIHKDWYNKEENQLCLTNEDMTKHFIDNLEKHIAKHPNPPYFFRGDRG